MVFATGILLGSALWSAAQKPFQFPATAKHPSTDEYHGVRIIDNYRWLEDAPNGSFNVTEFGSVKDPAQFKALYAYSPLHNVKDNTTYPAVLMLTGDNDGRVDPMQSRKMTARLQAATNSNLPILLRTSSNTGHGIGTGLSERIAEGADVFPFLFDQMKIPTPDVSK